MDNIIYCHLSLVVSILAQRHTNIVLRTHDKTYILLCRLVSLLIVKTFV